MPTAPTAVRAYDSRGEIETARARLLVLDELEAASAYDKTLGGMFEVMFARTLQDALSMLDRRAPDVVITELKLPSAPDVDCIEVCRRAKALPAPAAVLVTTSEVARVPAALAAGCEGVLLKPFAPNLLFTRLGRIRKESQALKNRPARRWLSVAAGASRSNLHLEGSNRVWPATHCPQCRREGAVSFDYASHRRMWYACLPCGNVWMAARQEDFKRRSPR